jgi:type I restriction enzyme S subunit
MANLLIPLPDIEEQRKISHQLKTQLAEVEKARKAVELQLREVENLGNAIVFDSIRKGKTKIALIGDVLDEVKKGVGDNWHEHLVLGATRNGLALAKEPPGKNPQRYKPVVPGTIFYNPMRIMIGSIAMVDDGDIQGITSPDYVVLKGGEGKVDSRWFYYWLRSPLGKHCINTLARGILRRIQAPKS